jgi:methyl-accepting chemotaxis protein
MIVVGLAALAGGLAASAAIAFRGIILPMRRVMASMARVSAGDLASSIDGAERRDEIGDIARAVASIRDAEIEKVRLERQAAELRAQTEAERARNESERQRNEADLAAVVDALASNLVRVADCDLTARIEEDFAGRYEQIKLDFNAAIARLEQTIRGVVTGVHAITAGSEQISTASDDLARRTELQAGTLEESTAAMSELAGAVNTTAESATWTKDTITTAKAATDGSIATVHQAVAAMDRILSSSKQVSQIVGVIDEIAFQTNLLALNAGVEAARAGDAGRGFAVVASEVRTLALRSTEAAKQIKALISQSASEVSDGVALVGATGEAFGRIKDQITIIDRGIADITTRALDQSTTIKQVNSAIFQIDQVTQQNASMAEEATAACRSLAEETSRLADTVREFNVSGAKVASRSARVAKAA